MGVILLVRHGQASFGANDYDQLSPLGMEQARMLGASLRSRVAALGSVVTGSMRRHRQTAELCLEAMGQQPCVAEDPGFDEFDHEEVIAKLPSSEERGLDAAMRGGSPDPRRAFRAMFVQAIERWAGGQHDSDYAQSWGAFQRRCLQAFERASLSVGRDDTALIFTSGGPIAVVMSSLLPIAADRAYELQLRLVNAGVSKVLVGRGGVSFGSLNDHSHFEHAGRRWVTHG